MVKNFKKIFINVQEFRKMLANFTKCSRIQEVFMKSTHFCQKQKIFQSFKICYKLKKSTISESTQFKIFFLISKTLNNLLKNIHHFTKQFRDFRKFSYYQTYIEEFEKMFAF